MLLPPSFASPRAVGLVADATFSTDLSSVTESELALQLPPEIWLRVFHYATWIPGFVAISESKSDRHAVTGFIRDRYGISVHNRFDEAMRVKLACSLVSQSWNCLIRQNMFEYLLIKSGEQATKLATMLRNSAGKTYRSPGWWTTRLEIALDGVYVWTAGHSNAILNILRSCPNLLCFSTAFNCTPDVYHFHSLLFMSTFRKISSLRRLELRADIPLLKAMIIAASQSLEVLWILPARRVSTSGGSWIVCLPRLHTLISTFGYGACLTKNFEMPNLHTLITDDPPDQQFCVERDGRQLLSLAVPNIALLSSSLALCPSLTEVIINYHTIKPDTMKKLTHASIRIIVVEDAEFVLRASYFAYINRLAYYQHLRSTLASLVSAHSFPALECVRFALPLSGSCEPNDASLPPELISIWAVWLQKCERRGILVQASLGADDWTSDKWSPLNIDFVRQHLHR